MIPKFASEIKPEMPPISEPGDNSPQMCTIQPLTGMRLVGGSVGFGALGAGILLSGLINLSTFGWRMVFVIPAACVCFGLTALNLRAAFTLARLRVEHADKGPTSVPMRMFWRWLLANLALLASVMVLCWLALPPK